MGEHCAEYYDERFQAEENTSIVELWIPIEKGWEEEMDLYEMMIKANHRLIKGDIITAAEQNHMTEQFLTKVSSKETANRFYRGVRYPGNKDSEGRRMYPLYFIPPYNQGQKYPTVLMQKPKTHILSANAYELEIIRLLTIFAPDDSQVKTMVRHTLKRLKTTCYGNTGCGLGECFDTALVTLRFLTAAAPQEIAWMKTLLDSYHRHSGDKHRTWHTKWYYWLCLSELPEELAQPEINAKQEEIIRLLSRSYVMNKELDKIIHPICICVLRNAVCRLEGYEYLKKHSPFLDKKDGRLHFNIDPVFDLQ